MGSIGTDRMPRCSRSHLDAPAVGVAMGDSKFLTGGSCVDASTSTRDGADGGDTDPVLVARGDPIRHGGDGSKAGKG